MKKSFKLKVYYYDTDKMGVVYHANYLKWMEMARTEFFNNSKLTYHQIEEMGYFLPVKTLNIEYIDSAKYGDEIEVVVEIKKMTNIKVEIGYEIYDSNNVLKVKASTLHVFTGLDGKLKRISKEALELLKSE